LLQAIQVDVLEGNNRPCARKSRIEDMAKSKPIYAFKVGEKQLLDRFIEITKERDMLRHKLDELMNENQLKGKCEQSQASHMQVNKEGNEFKETLERIAHELQSTITLMRTYPASDTNYHRLFLKNMENILEIAQCSESEKAGQNMPPV
jgi:chemotaxis protein histidine kinase CheA